MAKRRSDGDFCSGNCEKNERLLQIKTAVQTVDCKKWQKWIHAIS
jgi:hypothetical protein